MSFSFIDDFVSGSARPYSVTEMAWLRLTMKVKATLSLTESPLPSPWVEGMIYKHVPVTDHTAPTLEQLKECVDFLRAQVELRNKVVVHCAAGIGRTGTVLASYLCAQYGLTAAESIARVRTLRWRSIEKNEQEQAVEKFADSIGSVQATVSGSSSR